jgi:hypothetical protein
VQLPGDPLALLLLGAQRACRHVAEPLPVGVEPLQHPVEGAGEPLQVAVGDRRLRHPRVQLPLLDARRRLLQQLELRERELQDQRVHQHRHHHAGEREQRHEREAREGSVLLLQVASHDHRHDHGAEHHDDRVRDQDLVEEGDAQERAKRPRRRSGAGRADARTRA